MDVKMMMRIYAKAGGGSTVDPPYLRTPSKPAEKPGVDGANRRKATVKTTDKVPVRY